LAKPELGAKRVCQECGSRFYDLNREPIVCPKCGHQHTAEMFNRTRRGRMADATRAKVAKPVGAVPEIVDEELEDAEVEEVEGEEEESVIEDASELGEDEEDMAEVIENVDEDDVDVEER
jgi:uncharacterized protein (TIGR02300 family)